MNDYLFLKLLHELAAFWFIGGILGRQLVRRLFVFRGHFGREVATSVAGALLPILAALVDKSLGLHTFYQYRGRFREGADAFAAA